MSDHNSYIHDLKNKLAALQEFHELMKDRMSDIESDYHKKLIFQMNHLLKQLYLYTNNSLSFGLTRLGVPSLNLMIVEFVRDLSKLYPDVIFNYDYTRESDSLHFFLEMNRDLFFQVLDNLADNSYKAGATMVDYQIRMGEDGLHIVVTDNGCPTKVKRPVRGMIPSGQGLGIVQKNMNLMKGSAIVSSSDEEGVEVSLFCPRVY